MAVLFDASGAGNGSSSFTFSHIVSSDANYLFVQAQPNITAVDYNGDSLTLLSSYHPTSGTFAGNCPYVNVWGLANPDVGTHNISCTHSSGQNESAVSSSYKNILDVTHQNDSASVGGQVTTWESTVTLGINQWGIAFFAGANNFARTLQAYTNSTLRQANTGGEPISIMDSNGHQTPGSYSLWAQWSSGSGFVTSSTFVVSTTITTASKTEALAIADSISKSANKRLTEVTTIYDSVTKLVSRLFSETMTFTDSINNIKGTWYQLFKTETISVFGSIVNSYVFFIIAVENIHITDMVLDFAKKLRGLIRGKKNDINNKLGVRRT
jgi:hypothetical protein